MDQLTVTELSVAWILTQMPELEASRDRPAQPMQPSSFEHFSELPAELQIVIWEKCIPAPRTINVYNIYIREPCSCYVCEAHQVPNDNPFGAPPYTAYYNKARCRCTSLACTSKTHVYADKILVPAILHIGLKRYELVLDTNSTLDWETLHKNHDRLCDPKHLAFQTKSPLYVDLSRDVLLCRPLNEVGAFSPVSSLAYVDEGTRQIWNRLICLAVPMHQFYVAVTYSIFIDSVFASIKGLFAYRTAEDIERAVSRFQRRML